jgi:hypothetical protein
MFAGAAMLAAPLAALTLTSRPTAPVPEKVQASEPAGPYYAGAPSPAAELYRDSEEAVAAAVDQIDEIRATEGLTDEERRELEQDLAEARQDLREAMLEGPSSEAVSAAIASAMAVSLKAARGSVAGSSQFVTPEFATAMRAASPQLARASNGDLAALKVHGVSPAYVRDLEAAGLGGLTPKQLATAAVHRLDGRFLRSMAAVGYSRLTYDQAVKMRIYRVTPEFVRSLQRRGLRPSASEVVRMRIVGVDGSRHLSDEDRDIDVDLDVDIDPHDGS